MKRCLDVPAVSHCAGVSKPPWFVACINAYKTQATNCEVLNLWSRIDVTYYIFIFTAFRTDCFEIGYVGLEDDNSIKNVTSKMTEIKQRSKF